MIHQGHRISDEDHQLIFALKDNIVQLIALFDELSSIFQKKKNDDWKIIKFFKSESEIQNNITKLSELNSLLFKKRKEGAKKVKLKKKEAKESDNAEWQPLHETIANKLDGISSELENIKYFSRSLDNTCNQFASLMAIMFMGMRADILLKKLKNIDLSEADSALIQQHKKMLKQFNDARTAIAHQYSKPNPQRTLATINSLLKSEEQLKKLKSEINSANHLETIATEFKAKIQKKAVTKPAKLPVIKTPPFLPELKPIIKRPGHIVFQDEAGPDEKPPTRKESQPEKRKKHRKKSPVKESTQLKPASRSLPVASLLAKSLIYKPVPKQIVQHAPASFLLHSEEESSSGSAPEEVSAKFEQQKIDAPTIAEQPTFLKRKKKSEDTGKTDEKFKKKPTLQPPATAYQQKHTSQSSQKKPT